MDTHVGKAEPRLEDERFLRGRGTYVADVRPEGVLHAVFVRSPYAHARVRAIRVGKAKASPGVVAVLTAKDLGRRVGLIPTWGLGDTPMNEPPYWPLARGRVRYQGEAVAVVVADTRARAQDAADLVEVDCDPLPVVTDPEAALRDGAPRLHAEAPGNRAYTYRVEGGDPDAVFRQARVVVEQRLVNQRVQPSAMEPRTAVAEWDAKAGRLVFWANSQGPQEFRDLLARILHMPADRVHVISPDVGGAFGAKIAMYPTDVIVGHLARTLKRPVKWVGTRSEDNVATVHGRDQIQYARLAATKDGTILGIDVKAFANLGAYASSEGPDVPTGTGSMLNGCYRMLGGRFELVGVFTNVAPTGAYRGAGRPEAAYLVERMVDALARKLGLDPIELRRRNFIPPSAFPYKSWAGEEYDTGDYDLTLDALLRLVDVAAFRREQAEARRSGRLLGIGFSTYVEVCGFGPGAQGRSRCVLGRDGKVTVYSGGHPHGQGEETAFAQIVAEALGVPLADVRVVHGDTDLVPRGIGTGGSRTLPVEGTAVANAAKKVADKVRRAAAQLLEASEDDVVLEDGRLFVRGVPSRSVRLQDVARAAPGGTRGLAASTAFEPSGLTFPFGAHACIVEVDPETGAVSIRRYVAVDDCGNVVNPLLVEGQVHGGVVQGIAQALWEGTAYDEGGNLLTSNFMEYLVPTAKEAPAIESYRTVTPTPHNPLGAKGIGEAGAIAAPPAVVNAVLDALAPFGVEHLDMPVTPQAVWAAIHARRDKR